MSKRKVPKTWAEEIAELDDPAPRDFDPEQHNEDFDNAEQSCSDAGSADNANAREHYEDVGKSALRKPDAVVLGRQYSGLSISRDDLAAVDSDKHPFSTGREDLNDSEEGEFADSDQDLPEQEIDEDEEIEDDEEIGDGNEKKYEKGASRDRKKALSAQDRYDSESHGADGLDSSNQESEEEPGTLSSEERGLNNADEKSTRKDLDVELKLRTGSESSEHVSEDDDRDEDIESLEKKANEMSSEADNNDDSDSSDNEVDMEDANEFSDFSKDTSNDSVDNIDKPSIDGLLEDRATLRKMMVESQKTVVETITQAAKADLAKGKAIKHQRSNFDALLNTRIRLQKALVAINSLSAPQSNHDHTAEDPQPSFHAAETAALTLWTQLDDLRSSLHPSNSLKRPFSATLSTPSTTLWTHMKTHDSTFLPTRRATLTKWSSKLRPSVPLAPRSTLSTSAPPTPLTTLLDQHLSASNTARLLARTQTPRSCAPLQAASRIPLSPHIYDDADFYTLLLRDLVDQRMTDSSSSTAPHHPHSAHAYDGSTAITSAAPNIPSKAYKARKLVDRKASKGRKMRYTVHEKLQNFMAPEDRTTWGEKQVRELFAGLLGGRETRLVVDEDHDEDEEDDEGGGDGIDGEGENKKEQEARRREEEEEALMLFHR